MCYGCASVEVDEKGDICETCERENWCDKCECYIVENEGDLCDKCQDLEDLKERQRKAREKDPLPPHREEPPMRDVPRWGNGY